MKENESALYSHYIIDGVRFDMTPAEMLDECMEYEDGDNPEYEDFGRFDDIIDELTDLPVTSFTYDRSENTRYAEDLAGISNDERAFTMLYPDHFTRLQIAQALLNRLWSEGHFRLGNLRIWAQWEWNTRPIGNMAAFYSSAAAASEYIYGLGVRMTDYLFIENDGESSAKFFAWLPEGMKEDNEDDVRNEWDGLFKSSPYESRHPWISDSRRCPSTISDCPESTIVYIPFDTCPFKLGGTLLAQSKGHNGGPGAQIMDPDYFIDCYEVVRELIEDGVVIAGISVGDGGLATAAARMCRKNGAGLDISRLMASYGENDSTKVLFGETPGVLVQIKDCDFDYFDSQMILQDIAYYPLGSPDKAAEGVKFIDNHQNGVADILAALMNQASEGED